MWPSGAPKCCLLMLFLSFSEPHFFKIRLSEPAGTKPLDLGKKKTCGRSGYILVSLCEIGKGVKEIWDRWRKGPLCRKRNCFRKRKTVKRMDLEDVMTCPQNTTSWGSEQGWKDSSLLHGLAAIHVTGRQVFCCCRFSKFTASQGILTHTQWRGLPAHMQSLFSPHLGCGISCRGVQWGIPMFL